MRRSDRRPHLIDPAAGNQDGWIIAREQTRRVHDVFRRNIAHIRHMLGSVSRHVINQFIVARAPLVNEGAIDETLGDDNVDEAECERAVGARIGALSTNRRIARFA